MKLLNIAAGFVAGYATCRVIEAKANGVNILDALKSPFVPVRQLAPLTVVRPLIQTVNGRALRRAAPLQLTAPISDADLISAYPSYPSDENEDDL